MTTQMNPRRGITLLFVISLIVLFLLMGATFVAIAGNFMRVSEARSTLEVRGDSAATVLNRAMMDFVRGSTNTTSPLHDHNLLGDMYATGFKGTVATAVADAGSSGQMIRLTLNVTPPLPTDWDKIGAFSGNVLTFISNSSAAVVKGTSCRIFHYDVQYDAAGLPTTRSFLVVPEWSNGQNPFANPADLIGANVLVNGRAFAGTGADQTDPIDRTEPYDAIDLETPFMAGVDFDSVPWIYASFYHFGNTDYENFRPARFRGTALVDGDGDGRPDLEVDTDGDGILDSVWIDPGYPVQTDSSGRQYKALAAYFVIDGEGRFNLNLNGSGDDARGRNVMNLPLLGAPGIVSQGQGYGPAEIKLGRLFPPPGGFPATMVNYNQEYFNILGDPASQYYGRFGSDGDNLATPTGVYASGYSNYRDPWSQYKLFGHPTTGIGSLFGSRLDVFGKYGWGFPNVVLTTSMGDLPYGMPQIDATPQVDDVLDNPYETIMSGLPSEGPGENTLVSGGSNRPDQLFSLKELERIYRMYDMDSKFLANRLLALAPTTLSNALNRLRITTESWEVPVPPSNVVVELANRIQAVDPTRLRDIEASPFDATSYPPGQSPMLAPEILLGLKMDPNRPFGNGLDENANGYIDEYYADGGGEVGEPIPYPSGPVALDASRNGQANTDEPGVARAIFAKQLYVLALLRVQGAGDLDSDGNSILADVDDRKLLAQWSINVVDFRDPDAIMTPFEYDDNPFNGWITDGSLLTDEINDGIDNDGNGLIDGADPNEQATERGIVWGCERPELLITESIATHDRRTENADASDANFESRLIPVASAFIELYAPWVAGNDSTYPAEIYSGNQINLAQLTPTGGNPIWRIRFVREGNNEHYDGSPPDDRVIEPDSGLVPTYRNLYFIQPPLGYGADVEPNVGLQSAESFYPTAGFNTFLTVGQHAVVGSSGNIQPVVADDYISTFGRRLTAIEGDVTSFDFPNTRSITLDPVAGEVRTRDFDSATSSMATRTKTGVLAIPIANPRSFNVSDPPNGYLVDSLGAAIPFLPVEDGLRYSAVRDVPIDYELKQSDVEYLALRDDRTTPTFRVMYLQRLANPSAPWDASLNPYLTVDSASMNLTAFNGVTSDVDPYVPDPPVVPSGPSTDANDINRDFASFERGKSEKYPVTGSDVPVGYVDDPDDHRLLWRQERRLIRIEEIGPPAVVADDIGNPIDLAQELAGLDQHYFSTTVYESLGIFNESHFGPGLDATKPFTWLTWNNRPYVSPYELMLVPTKASWELLKNYTAKGADNPYGDLSNVLDPAGNGFQHLPNFFLQQVGGGILPIVKLELYKLLDFVEVPPRYIGTERYFNSNPASTMSIFGLAPPFNHISRFRYPGKVNINTILDSEFWAAVMGDYATIVPAGGPFLDYLAMNGSRRSSNTNEFRRPFREYSYASPLENPGNNFGLLRGDWNMGPDGQWGVALVDDDTNGTVDDQDEAGYVGSDDFVDNALFDFDPLAGQQAHNNSDRNAYFRFDAIQRMGNTVTTRSSVFAVWVTVGYFEVDPATGDLLTTTPATCELGLDSGQVKRHRGFFIIDRSVPVGFEQGIDHNVGRAVMVESYIE